MVNNKNVTSINNSSISFSNLPKLSQPHRLINATVLAGLIGLMALTSVTSHAAPSANANERAQNNFTGDSLPENARAKRKGSEEWARGRILVMPRAGLPAQALANILKEHEGKPKKIGQSDLYIVDLPEYTEEGAIARLAHHPHLKFVELDYLVSAELTPNDPYYRNAWHLPKIGAPTAWDSSQGTGIIIAILDTGVDSSHSDLSARIVPGWNFYDNNSNTSDVHGHGTLVAGSAAASSSNSIGVASVAGQAKIMPIRVASPSATASSSTIANGLVYAADRGARVANISYANQPMRAATITASQYMKDKGGLVTVSAGNYGVDEGFTPTTAMIPVSATDGNDVKTSWSSYGNYVAMAAPGTGIWTTALGGGYSAASGTSFSSPVTAGVIALMMAANTQVKNTDIEKTLFSTAKDLGATGRDPYYGYGRIDAAAAVKAVATTTAAVDTEAPNVSILDPLSGATVSGLVPVDIAVTDNVGVARAELWVNNTSVAVDTSLPFAFTWDSKGAPNGTANLTVRAVDSSGNAAVSNSVKVNVSNQTTTAIVATASDTSPPTVKITNPVSGSVKGNVTITINASDNYDAANMALAIYIDGTLKTTGTGSTLSTNWNTRPKSVTVGKHTIKAVAKDKAGNTSFTTVDVTVIK